MQSVSLAAVAKAALSLAAVAKAALSRPDGMAPFAECNIQPMGSRRV